MTADPALLAMMTSVFTDRPRTPGRLDRSLWDTLASLGLTRLTTPVRHGGSGAGWPEAAALLRTAAAHGVAAPLAENDLLAGWLLAQADLPGDDEPRTACILDRNGAARAVPWAREAAGVVALWWTADGWRAGDLPASSLTLTPGTNLGGEPRDDLRADLSGVRGTPVLPDVAEEFLLRGGLARALQMTGAMDGILDLCLDHVRTRTQFGRPLARFQAVQSLIADLAAEAALARAAATACTRGTPGPFGIAVARSCAGHAATVAVRNAHQIHGAIGTTAEHALHTLTLPLLAWRTEYGTPHDWDDHLTTTATTAPLWPTLTGD